MGLRALACTVTVWEVMVYVLVTPQAMKSFATVAKGQLAPLLSAFALDGRLS